MKSSATKMPPCGSVEEAVYRERNRVIAALAACFPSSQCRDDETPGWRVVFVELPTGQVSWHFHAKERPLFAHVPTKRTRWDGHSTQQKYRRLERFARRPR